MKDKRGFTLVELLAVIAILAILVIIALPNVMGLFNEAKKNSFTTEIKELFKVAEQTWMNDSMEETKEVVYARVHNGECGKLLDLTGRTLLEYYIKVNKAGKIVQFYATDGTYSYSYEGNGLRIEDISNIETASNSHVLKKLEQLCGISGEDGVDETAPQVTDAEPGKLAGEGTYENPYKIESMEDLVAFAIGVNTKKYKNTTMVQKLVDGAYIYYDKFFTLETDLNFKSKNSYVNYEDTSFGDINKDGNIDGIMQEINSGKGFPVISEEYEKMYGAGFDGKGHTIKNYNHKIVETDASKKVESSFWGYAGTLLYLANLNFENVDIDIDAAGNADVSTLLLNCSSINTYNIRNIKISGNIKVRCGGDCNVGGVMGIIGGQATTTRMVPDVYFTGNIDVKAKNANVGGFGAATKNYGYVTNGCHYKGNINVEASEKANVGGLIGDAMRFISVNSSVIGNLNVKAKDAYVYGIASATSGEVQNGVSTNGIIHHSFFKGNINVESTYNHDVAGLGKTKINNSYFIGNIKYKVAKRNNSTFNSLLTSSGPVYNSYSIGNFEYIESDTPENTSRTVYLSLLASKGGGENSFSRGKLSNSQVSYNKTYVGLVTTKYTNPNINPGFNCYYTEDSSYSGSSTPFEHGSLATINNLKDANWYRSTLQIGSAWETRDDYYPRVRKCDYIPQGYVCRIKDELVENQEWIKVEN